KELMTVGKIWYEATRTEGGRPAWDAIVVDAPATGHSLQYLRMPQAARETFGAGLVQREATKITNFLRDPRTTAVHLVTLAEESGWSAINAANLARLRAGIGDAPLIELPFLFVEEFGCTELEQTARLLEAGMAGRAEPAARRRSRSS